MNKEIKADILRHEALIKEIRERPYLGYRMEDFVVCDRCGCLLRKDYEAISGKGEIRQKRVPRERFGFYDEDYIHYPHYCKIHKPKK